jgi:hypothetical protein
VIAKTLTIKPSSLGVAPSWTAYSGSSGSMIETPTLEMKAIAARTTIGRSSSRRTANLAPNPPSGIAAGYRDAGPTSESSP